MAARAASVETAAARAVLVEAWDTPAVEASAFLAAIAAATLVAVAPATPVAALVTREVAALVTQAEAAPAVPAGELQEMTGAGNLPLLFGGNPHFRFKKHCGSEPARKNPILISQNTM
jgi:hypothetical protein